MTTPLDPATLEPGATGEVWSDGRLAAAFHAYAASSRPDTALAYSIRAAVATAPPTAGRPTWNRRLLAAAAVVAVALAGGLIANALPDRSIGPGVSPTAPAPSSSSIAPPGALGLPVIDVPAALEVRRLDRDDRELAVRGWVPPFFAIRCVSTPMTSPVQPACPDEWSVLMAAPESLAIGSVIRLPSGPAFQIDLDAVTSTWRPSAGSGQAAPTEVVAIGHFDDRRSAFCPARDEQACRDRFVVDRVDWVDGTTLPTAIGFGGQGATSTVDEIIEQVATVTGGPVLSVELAVDPQTLIQIEPGVPPESESLLPHDVTWLVRVLEGDRATTYLVPDLQRDVYRVDTDNTVEPAATGDLPAEILGLPVVDVGTALADYQAVAGNDGEIAVRGWLSSAVRGSSCRIMDPTCLGGGMVDADLATAPGGGIAMRVVTPTGSVNADALHGKEVILVGHFHDRRAGLCPNDMRDVCEDLFVADTAWVDGRLVDPGWSDAPNDTDAPSAAP